jgi:PAS domain S-box-containing protein
MTQIILSAQYDWRLIALSVAVAAYAAFIAFDLAGRIASSQGRRQALWLGCGATAMGLGIWAMHCIGMLALILPVPVLYNVPIVFFSLLIAIASCSVALFVVSQKDLSEVFLVGGSLALGGGIAATHYAGLAAMRLAAYPVYNPGFVALSVIVAVVGSGAALQLARLRNEAKNPTRMRVASAAAMGFAIAAAHYISMAAITFHSAQWHAGGGSSVGAPSLSITGIALLTLAVLALSLIGSHVDRTFSAQRQLLLSEQERWLLVVSTSMDGLFDFNLVTGQVFYSPRWKALAGYGPDELDSTLETWRQLIHPEDRQMVENELTLYLRGCEGAFEMEYRISHRDGSTRWILARAQAVWDDAKPVRLVGYHSDITERKRSEEKLRISEARYRELFDSNPLPSWIYSPENLRILDANQAAMEYYGWSRDQFLGLSVSSMRMPGEPEAAEVAHNGERAKPWRYRTKNNRGIWVEPTTYGIEAAGAPARLMMVKDVTDHIVYQTKIEQTQRQLEGAVAQKTSELQTSEAQWHALVEDLPQFVWSARPDGSFDYLSHQWAEYSGVPQKDLLGSGWLSTLHPSDRPAAQSCWLTALETGGRFEIDYRIRAKDGTYHWFAARGIPVRAAVGKAITHWMGTSTDKEDPKLATESLELALT